MVKVNVRVGPVARDAVRRELRRRRYQDRAPLTDPRTGSPVTQPAGVVTTARLLELAAAHARAVGGPTMRACQRAVRQELAADPVANLQPRITASAARDLAVVGRWLAGRGTAPSMRAAAVVSLVKLLADTDEAECPWLVPASPATPAPRRRTRSRPSLDANPYTDLDDDALDRLIDDFEVPDLQLP